MKIRIMMIVVILVVTLIVCTAIAAANGNLEQVVNSDLGQVALSKLEKCYQ